MPLAYSEGKRPSPHISIAAPLPQGVTSKCELLDLYLTDHLAPAETLRRLSEHLPCGMQPLACHEVGLNCSFAAVPAPGGGVRSERGWS